MVTHSLRGEGFDASEDGTGRGTPLVPVTAGEPCVAVTLCKDTYSGGMGGRPEAAAVGHVLPVAMQAHPPSIAYAVRTANTSANGHGISPGLAHTLDQAQGQAIAFNWNAQPDQMRFDAHCSATLTRSQESAVAHVALMPTMTSGGPTKTSHNQVSGQMRDAYMVPTTAMQVRRLTPTECERLQGFPDGYTAIPWRKKPASECPDGPRYKALGNSWAVPNVRWIGARIAAHLNPNYDLFI